MFLITNQLLFYTTQLILKTYQRPDAITLPSTHDVTSTNSTTPLDGCDLPTLTRTRMWPWCGPSWRLSRSSTSSAPRTYYTTARSSAVSSHGSDASGRRIWRTWVQIRQATWHRSLLPGACIPSSSARARGTQPYNIDTHWRVLPLKNV